MPKYGPYMQMTSLTVSAHGAVFPSLVSPFHCKVLIPNNCPFLFFFCSFFPLTSVAVSSRTEFCILCLVALKVTDLNSELPGNRSCFGILLSVRSGCMLTEARGITTQLSSTPKRAWSRGWPAGHRAPCSMIVSVYVCVSVNGSSWSRIFEV